MPTPQQKTPAAPEVGFALAEEGEAIGTVRQYANHLNLPESQVLSCLHRHDEEVIVLRAGPATEPLLIVGAGGVEALLGCTASTSADQESGGRLVNRNGAPRKRRSGAKTWEFVC
jgi:hypothetical protein